MRATGRAAADRLKAALVAGRQAAADEVLAIRDLVVDYDIAIDDDLIDELLVGTTPGGALGTPEVHEFVHLELCGLMGLSARQARVRIFEALNLYYRHPTLWMAVQQLGLEMRRACVAATRCGLLTPEDADVVGRQWYHQQEGLGWKGAFDLLDRLIIEADPALAKKRQDQAAACREVVLRGHNDGVIDVTARMDALDAMYLDATVDQLADILRADEANAAHTKQVLRAKALGILATPALALGLQQQALNPDPDGQLAEDPTETGPAQAPLVADPAQQPEPSHEDSNEDEAPQPSPPSEEHSPLVPAPVRPTPAPVLDPETGRINRDPHQCIGHACGRITIPPAKLQPKSKIYIHIDNPDLSRLGGAAFMEKVGWMSSLSLKSELGGKNVTIQPVIDLNPSTCGTPSSSGYSGQVAAEHQYRPSARMREATQLLFPVEAFPFSHTPSRGVDLDHSNAYQRSSRDAQTGIGNLAPLHRTIHRAKTVAAWHARQRIPGEIVWTSPLNFQYTVTPERTFARE